MGSGLMFAQAVAFLTLLLDRIKRTSLTGLSNPTVLIKPDILLNHFLMIVFLLFLACKKLHLK